MKRVTAGATLVGAIVVYGALIMFGRLADRLILWPQPPEGANGAERLEIPFEGGVIEVWRARGQVEGLQRGARPGAFILSFYGNADLANRWVSDQAQSWRGRDVEVWGVNYPGYGGSTGPATLARIARASTTAFRFLADHAQQRPIYVYGISLGTTAALSVAARHAVAGVYLQNPPPLPELIRGAHGWWNAWLLAYPVSLQIPPELRSIENARQSRAPAIFVLSAQDEVVPIKYQRMVEQSYAGPKRTILLAKQRHNDAIPDDGLRQIERAMAELWQ